MASRTGPLATGSGLPTNTRVAVALPSPAPTRPVPRSVPLGVIFRSSTVVIVGGPTKVMIRPTPKRRSRALMGTLLCRYGSLGKINNMTHPKVIRELSVSAAKVLVMTGSRAALGDLRTRFRGRAARGRCLTLIRNSPATLSNHVRDAVNQRPASEGGVTCGPPHKNGRTMDG